MPENPLPSPGWYHDPSGAEQQRWWDGTGWSEHVIPLEDATIATTDTGTGDPDTGDTDAADPDATDPNTAPAGQAAPDETPSDDAPAAAAPGAPTPGAPAPAPTAPPLTPPAPTAPAPAPPAPTAPALTAPPLTPPTPTAPAPQPAPAATLAAAPAPGPVFAPPVPPSAAPATPPALYGTPSYGTPAYGPAAPGTPAGAPTGPHPGSPAAPAPAGVDGWPIWVIVLLPLIPTFTLPFVDFGSYFRALEYSSSYGGGASFPAAYGVLVALSALVWGATVLLGWLDQRELVARGVRAPFPWAFAFLGPLVYVIGRTVVLRRRLGRGGFGPLIALIVVAAVSFLVGFFWTIGTLLTLLTATASSSFS
ncbi:MAG: DUF2510 domain-containing protein [Microbacteriaceae bacterium]